MDLELPYEGPRPPEVGGGGPEPATFTKPYVARGPASPSRARPWRALCAPRRPAAACAAFGRVCGGKAALTPRAHPPRFLPQDFDTVRATRPATGAVHRPYLKRGEDREGHVAPTRVNPNAVAAALAMTAGAGAGHGNGGGGGE